MIWFEIAGHKITPAQFRDLVTRGKTKKTKAGQLVLDPQADPPVTKT